MLKCFVALLLIMWVISATTFADPPIPFNYQIGTPFPELQNEEQIWICPTDSTVVIAVWRDFRLGYRQIGIGRSYFLPEFWTDSLLSPAMQLLQYQSDPTLSVDKNGNFYMCQLDYMPTGTYEDPSYITFLKSTDKGLSWTGPVPVEDGVGAYFEDKQFITVDRTNGPYSGNVYVSWTRFPWPTRIMFARSTDGALSFDDTLIVGPPVNDTACGVFDFDAGQFSNPLVDASGNVYVFWIGPYFFPPDCWGYYSLKYAKSTDGGVSFSSPAVIRTTFGNWGQVDGGIDVYNQPIVDADITGGPFNGNIYVAYASFDTLNPYFAYDIEFVRSIDGGATWLGPTLINDGLGGDADSIDQFHPWMVCNQEGTLVAIWYDQRTDPVNHYLFDVFAAYSFDGGSTFTRNHRISDVSIDPGWLKKSDRSDVYTPLSLSPTAAQQTPMAGKIAEYIGVSAYNDYVHAVWTDTRYGNQDVFGANWTIPFMAPILISPIDSALTFIAGDSIEILIWSTSWKHTLDWYQIEVATEPTFSSPDTFYSDFNRFSLHIDSLPVAAEYFWRVKASKIGPAPEPTAYSETRMFRRNISCCTLRGDVNESNTINVSDLTFLVNYLFKSGPAPVCQEEGDVNANGSINVADLTYLVNYLFKSGPPPLPC